MTMETQTEAQSTISADAGKPETAVETKAVETKVEAAVVDQKESEAKQASEETKAQDQKVVPEKYDLKIPEISHLTNEQISKIEAFAKSNGLTNEQAQGVLESENSALAGFLSDRQPGGKVWTAQVDAWEQAALADKDIGGTKENLAQSAELGRRVVDRFFPPEVKTFLNETGFGSHPMIL